VKARAFADIVKQAVARVECRVLVDPGFHSVPV
jgi:hypothetical protein